MPLFRHQTFTYAQTHTKATWLDINVKHNFKKSKVYMVIQWEIILSPLSTSGWAWFWVQYMFIQWEIVLSLPPTSGWAWFWVQLCCPLVSDWWMAAEPLVKSEQGRNQTSQVVARLILSGKFWAALDTPDLSSSPFSSLCTTLWTWE